MIQIITNLGSGGGLYQSSGQEPKIDGGSKENGVLPGYGMSYTWIEQAAIERPPSIAALVTANLVVKCPSGENSFVTKNAN